MSSDLYEGTEGPDSEFGTYVKVYGYGGDDSLVSNATFARMYGGADDDALTYTGSGKSWLYGEGGNDGLYGGNQNDKLYGGGGDDWIFGGLGKNVMWGGGGRDHFVFNSLPDGKPDKIKDFKPKKDFLNFDPGVYAVGIGLDALPKSEFRYGEKAKDGDDHFGYNKETGIVWYDPDGKGGEDQFNVTKLDKDLGLTYVNFQF